MKRFAQRTGFTHFSSFSRLTFARSFVRCFFPSLTFIHCARFLCVFLKVLCFVLRATFLRLFARHLLFPLLTTLTHMFPYCGFFWPCSYWNFYDVYAHTHTHKWNGVENIYESSIARLIAAREQITYIRYHMYEFTAQFLLFSISVLRRAIDARTKSSHHLW